MTFSAEIPLALRHGFQWFGLQILTGIVLVVPNLAQSAVGNAPSVGLNKFELTKQYLGTASGGDGSERYRNVTVPMARKALADANDAGVRFMRVAASGFAPAVPGQPGDLDLWVKDASAYWTRLDSMFDDLDAAGLQMVPSFIWNVTQFPAMNNETVRDLVTNPTSAAYLMAERYVREFIQRYKGRKTILFYELTNELNLGADLDTVRRCSRDTAPPAAAPLCKAKGNFSTDEMISFTKRLAAVVRQADGSRQISSGFSVPRAAAEHLRARPEWVYGTADFSPDTVEQYQRNLMDIHSAVDIISVHLYPVAGNARFGESNVKSTSLLEQSQKLAIKAGKPLFVGEFGDSERLDASPDSYTVRMLNKLVELKVPYSAVWAWQFYQRSPYQTRDNTATAYSLEPGFTDELIQKISDANVLLGNAVAGRPAADLEPPRLVLTWPLECTKVKSIQGVHAVASDNSGYVAGVDFLLNNKLTSRVTRPPYQTILKLQGSPAGEYVLTARASDQAGNTTVSTATITVGSGYGFSCPRTFIN
jgi:Cellulase (glycosyl hydrolase family 5)